MTLAKVLTDAVVTLTTPELSEARGIIGASKLNERLGSGVDFTAFPNGGGSATAKLREYLRGMNARIDAINSEDMRRQAGAKTR